MALAEMQRRPSAAELEALTEAYRRDPGSPAFVSLGEALIALGRPRDAVEIGARGLRANPQNLHGRLMVATAFIALHQWKEAQAELLKVVKSDRNNGPAFRALGEVLLRRADNDRAVPVLQHAHNLAPADPSILDLLRRARSGQPPDPPPPIPTPLAPAASGAPQYPGAPQRPAAPPPPPGQPKSEFEDIPTRVAGEAYTAQVAEMIRDGRRPQPGVQPPSSPALARMQLDQVEVRGNAPPPPTEMPVRQTDGRGADSVAPRPLQIHAPPPAESPFAPMGGPPAGPGHPTMGMSPGPQPPPQTGYTPPSVAPKVPRLEAGARTMSPTAGRERNARPSAAPPTVRPRVVSARRSEQAAHESLRQSAAVGEMYLNNLLTAGLLDVPNVRVGELKFDVNPDRKWGRSSARMFIYLFVIGAMAVAGIGTWYWYSEKQRKEDVAQHLEVAAQKSLSGSYVDLDTSLAEIRSALKRDPSSLLAIARYAQVAGLNSLLYGEIPTVEVQRALTAIKKDVTGPGDEGYREVLIARATITLASLGDTLLVDELEGAEGRLAKTLVDLRAWLDSSPEDRLVRWLEGKALLAQGDRNSAEGAFAQAWSTGAGEVLAGIDIGDMMLDEGRAEDALKIYNEVLEKSEDHPLAIVGRALLRAEESREAGELMKDISIGLAKVQGTRAKAYKALAEATAALFLEDYDKFKAALAQAVRVNEPRFLARVALAQLAGGEIKKAAAIRDRIRWFSEKPQINPLVKYVDAELLWHTGDARGAIASIDGLSGLRANSLRGRAHFDLGDFRDARNELEAALNRAPDDRMLGVWTQASKLILAGNKGDRDKAEEELNRLALQSTTKAARYPPGVAFARLGRMKDARTSLEASIEDLSEDYPNPLEYRSLVALAAIGLAEQKVGEANSHLTRALELNPGYLAAHDLMGQLLVGSARERALNDHLKLVVAADMASANGELAYAMALAPLTNKTDRQAAIAAFKRAQKKGVQSDALKAAIEKVDEALFEELGVSPK